MYCHVASVQVPISPVHMIEPAMEENYLTVLPDKLLPGRSADDASVAYNWSHYQHPFYEPVPPVALVYEAPLAPQYIWPQVPQCESAWPQTSLGLASVLCPEVWREANLWLLAHAEY